MKISEEKKKVIAVAGQPNSGKTTIFNLLTGARQHVANYPGVTVEKKTGSYRFKGDRFECKRDIYFRYSKGRLVGLFCSRCWA